MQAMSEGNDTKTSNQALLNKIEYLENQVKNYADAVTSNTTELKELYRMLSCKEEKQLSKTKKLKYWLVFIGTIIGILAAVLITFLLKING